MMFQPTYFPPLEPFSDPVQRTTQVWKVKDPQTIKPDGTAQVSNDFVILFIIKTDLLYY